MNSENIIGGSFVLFNTIYSISTIENIFSIVLLAFQLVYLLILVVLKIYKSLQDKKLTDEEVEDIRNTMDEIKDTIKGGNENEEHKKQL